MPLIFICNLPELTTNSLEPCTVKPSYHELMRIKCREEITVRLKLLIIKIYAKIIQITTIKIINNNNLKVVYKIKYQIFANINDEHKYQKIV